MTDVDELERRAKAALSPDETSGTRTQEFDAEGTAFYKAANPQTVLALIAELRALREVAKAADKFYNAVIDCRDNPARPILATILEESDEALETALYALKTLAATKEPR